MRFEQERKGLSVDENQNRLLAVSCESNVFSFLPELPNLSPLSTSN